MSYTGHCICKNIQVSLAQQPASSLRCHCRNCARSGGGSSLNYVLDSDEVTLSDPHSLLKSFDDTDTLSGNVVLRQFCSQCGSPFATKSPQFPGKTHLKASLFDVIARPEMEVFTDRRQGWVGEVEGARQG
ncbi:hypothetical protein BO94DRAFT_520745 [Aspergillus sclerotioniger CBS 115572]|uniref:CENP-V/GFA domain-containing protein n=1 Tax=Aspergillus sclerotioniger CBS 115572 TaxID=1450535 RepID=A0A317W5D0_9EURO|nr:hypothetical protein BO94DRAFT_520745 [Aspergillus sclerotioniger CBS 115572]PWY80801.1 hypothetical protein BO94DRAFT_520745 [Aspergillus sclerotioniger CBS 115572]